MFKIFDLLQKARKTVLKNRSFRVAVAGATLLGTTQTGSGQQLDTLEQSASRIVTQQCVTCHNVEKPTSGLDLSRRGGAIAGGQSGPALVPGDPEASLMYRKVAAGEMPFGNPLPPQDREIIRRWIEAGASWGMVSSHERKRADGTWWSLQPLKTAQLPASDNIPDDWRRSPIDRWVYAGMARKGLRPAPEADRRTLMRRAYFDLIGLPPSPEELEDFVSDPNPRAYEALIDRLLASPRYGERWARHWLDVVGFGESDGFGGNKIRDHAWPFRDYVIRSLNEDKPFDQMILEQLAGDVISAGDPETEVATGFLVAGPRNTVKVANIESNLKRRAVELDGMITATAGSFLGLTVHCARCHDHKFDPISQEDYYRLQAVFAGVEFGERPWAAPEMVAANSSRTEELRLATEKTETGLKALKEEAALRLESRRSEILQRFGKPVDARGTEETFSPVEAGYVRMTILGASQRKDPPVLDELEVWSSGPRSRNVALASLGARATSRSTRKADDNEAAYSVDYIIDGRFDKSWWSGDPGTGQVTIKLPGLHRIDRIFWSRDRQGAYGGIHERCVPVSYVIEVSRDGEDWQAVADTEGRLPFEHERREEVLLKEAVSRQERAQWDEVTRRLEELKKAREGLEDLPVSFAGIMRQPEEPTRLLKRGDPMQPGEIVSPGSPGALAERLPPFELSPDAPESERRLALARWITHDENPLTARVLANRLWHYHFGSGLVETPNDFGFNGARPTHPDLLDWLARRIRMLGWRWKPFHKEIMLSRTYRQSSRHVAEFARIDQDERFLWRFPPRRLEAEALRDSILAVSGKLDLRMGGPGFRLYRYSVDIAAIYHPLEEFDESTLRRAIYHQSVRAVRPGLLGPFDCPDSAFSAPRREVSTTPLQALALLNGRFSVQQAEFMAQRIAAEVGSHPGAQVDRAFGLAFGRKPEPPEREAAIELIEGEGLAAFCRAVINTNEFIFVM